MKRNNPDISAIIAALGGTPVKKKNQYLQKHTSKDALLQQYLMKNKMQDPFYQKYEKSLYGTLNNPFALEDGDASEVIPMHKSQIDAMKSDLESKYKKIVADLQRKNEELIKNPQEANPLLQSMKLVMNYTGATAAMGEVLNQAGKLGDKMGLSQNVTNMLLYMLTFGSIFGLKWLTKKKFEAATKEILGVELKLPVKQQMDALNQLLSQDDITEDDMPKIVQALIDIYSRLNAVGTVTTDQPTKDVYDKLKNIMVSTMHQMYKQSEAESARRNYRLLFGTFETALDLFRSDDLPYISIPQLKFIMSKIPEWAEDPKKASVAEIKSDLKMIANLFDPDIIRAGLFHHREKVGKQFGFTPQVAYWENRSKDYEKQAKTAQEKNRKYAEQITAMNQAQAKLKRDKAASEANYIEQLQKVREAQEKLQKDYAELQAQSQDDAKTQRIETLSKDREYFNQHRALVRKFDKIARSSLDTPSYSTFFNFLRSAILDERWLDAEAQINAIGYKLSQDLSTNYLSEAAGKKIAKLIYEGKDAMDDFAEKYGDLMIYSEYDIPELPAIIRDDPKYLEKRVPRPDAVEDLDIASLFE